MDESWKQWLKTNVDRECDKTELVQILQRHQFDEADIVSNFQALCPQFAVDPSLPRKSQRLAQETYARLFRLCPSLPQQDPKIEPVATTKAQIFVIDNFLSQRRCEELTAIIKGALRPSTITVPHLSDRYYRTSSTTDMLHCNSRLVDFIDLRIAATLGIRLSYGEELQGQHYTVGQEFKEHTDYFEPNTAEYDKFASAQGNRTWTFMVYLSAVEKGGQTTFPRLEMTFDPQPGRAIVWNNLNEDGSVNAETLHASLPIEEGEKTIITKWFRERGTGDMFYAV